MLIFDGSEARGGPTGSEDSEQAPGIVRLSVNLLEETGRSLKELSESRGESLTDTVNYALSLVCFIEDEVSKGKILMLSDSSRKEFWDIVTS